MVLDKFLNRQTLLLLLLSMLSFFWLLNAAEKNYSLFNKPAYEETILGTEEYLEKYPERQSDYTKINGKLVAKDFFRNPSRWHQLRKWWLRSVDNESVVDVLSFYTLLSGAIFETAILLVFIIALANTIARRKFDHKNYQLGILMSIILFTSLYFFDAFLDGNRLELFEHLVYNGMLVIFYFASSIDLYLKKLQVIISDWSLRPAFLNGLKSLVLKRAFILLFMASSFAVYGQSQNKENANQFKFKGNFRFSVEQDFESLKDNGSQMRDLLQLHMRFEFDFTKNINKSFSVGMQIRIGKLDEIELKAIYSLTKKVNLQVIYYNIQSEVKLGQRLRIDLNAKF